MEKREFIGVVLLSTILPAFIIGSMVAGVPGDMATKFVAVLIPAFVAFVLSVILTFALMR
jgi:uncharacterized membrane protein YqgA involved in biofilm formation